MVRRPRRRVVLPDDGMNICDYEMYDLLIEAEPFLEGVYD